MPSPPLWFLLSMPDGPKSFAVYKPEATAVGAAGAVLPSSPLRLAWFQPSAGGSAAGTALALANGYGQQPPKSGGWLSICVSDRLIPIAFNGAGTLLAMGSERGTVHLWRVGQPPGDKDKGGGSSAPPSSYNGNGNGGGNAHSLLESMDGNINAGTHSAHLTGAFTCAAAAYLPIPLPPGMGANNNVLGGAGERRCVVGLSSMTPHLMVISSDGYLYAYSIDLERGGECVLVKQYSCWVPCIDNLWEKCTWEFEFVVPWYLKEISVEDDEPTDASPTLVVCSGELVEQVVHPYSSHKTIFLFSQAVLTSVHHIAYDPNRLLSLPLRFDSSTFLLLIVDLLHAEDAIEQSLETRHTLSHARQAAVQAAAVGDMEAAEAMGMVDMGFGLEVWEKESEQNNWRVEDWTEEDETAMSGATYKWIHMDVDCEWITDLKFDQQDFMWVSQLQRDRDVVAQLEQPAKIVSSTLTKTVLVLNYFRIRCEAAVALLHDPNQDLFAHTYVPKPNNFSDLSEYFMCKALIGAISRTCYPNGKSLSIVQKFLIDQLRYNDNTPNTTASISAASPERGELLPDTDLLKQSLFEVDRYQAMDRLIPSIHNNVTIACLKFYLKLMVEPHPKRTSSVLPADTVRAVGKYTQVRIPAFDGLFMTIMNYVLAVTVPRILRRFVARCACLSLAPLVWIGEMKLNSKDPEPLLIEEAGSIPDKNKESRKSKIDKQMLGSCGIDARKVAVLRVEFTPESGITAHVVGEEAGRRLMDTFDSDGVWLLFKVDGAAGEAVVGVDVVHDNEIKAVKPLPLSPSSSSAVIAGDTRRHRRPEQR
ncbi:hypothetical protein B0H14DRAFT_3866906 [Mycena olivaceomarginata]|nr:hypothetical protein B0H14DRAFT_3866906 [Mycena olivaceomarginata]